MNVAIIIAGGVGNRMGQSIPKQFINVYDKPILIYTLEGFEKHPMVDAIEVVCIEGWENVVWSYFLLNLINFFILFDLYACLLRSKSKDLQRESNNSEA